MKRPRIFGEGFRDALRGGAKVAPLHDWCPNYLEFAVAYMGMIAGEEAEDEDLAEAHELSVPLTRV